MKTLLLLPILGLFVPLLLSAGDAVIAEGGRSAYTIVVADPIPDRMLDRYVMLAGELVRRAVRDASGVMLPLVRESAAHSVRRGIYVGSTRKLADSGLNRQPFPVWGHAIAERNGDIFVWGRDEGNGIRGVEYPNWYVRFMTGTLKAAATFVEKFAETRILHGRFNSYGLNDGVRTLPSKRLAVPEKFSYRHAPRILASSSGNGIVADVANNLQRPSRGWFLHAHTHAVAVPQARYFKTHPEYFALVSGQRYRHPERPQYCISNPGFQKLLYDYLLKAGRSGARVIALGQSDGTVPCECEKCRKLYGVSEYSEKLWILHRTFAERFAKDCPGVKIVLYNYGATIELPRTFTKFPDNVIIMVAPASKKLMRQWERYSPTEFWCYAYYWGSYLGSGFSPSRSFQFLKQEIGFLNSPEGSRIRMIHIDGGAPFNGLEGPFRYAFARWLDDPEQRVETLLHDYCRFGYGEKAALAMEEFFRLLDRRLEKRALPENEDWNDFSRMSAAGAVKVWTERYPADVVNQLEALLSKAEKDALPGNYLVWAARWEFNYLKVTARAVEALNAFNRIQNKITLRHLVEAIIARNRFIGTIPRSRLFKDERSHEDLFGGRPIKRIHEGGSMQGMFGEPITMDITKIVFERRSLCPAHVRDFSGVQALPVQRLKAMDGGDAKFETRFQIGHDGQNLLIAFAAELDAGRPALAGVGPDGAAWKTDCIEFFLMPPGDENCYQIVLNPEKNSFYDARRHPASGKTDASWNGTWQLKSRFAGNVWFGEFTLPLKSVAPARQSGEWKLQVGREAYRTVDAMRELSVWNIPLNGKFGDPAWFGTMKIEK